jgi:hypothetical protein
VPGRTNHEVGDVLGKWTLVEYIETGGNGDVWRAEAEGTEAALKILHRTSPVDYARFRREVEICERRDPSEIDILPVLDSHLPEAPSKKDRPWFAMPVAETLVKALAGAALTEKVAAVRDVARTLARLLEEDGVNHRDVKLENLYVYEGRTVVGDLGLAKRPEDPNLTETGDVPGPFFHLPSEAFLEEEPNWERVDVFCLANSLWRLAMERKHPPRGQIRASEEDSLIFLLPNEPYISRLASMIELATSRSPAARPTMGMFGEQLDSWLIDRSSEDEFAVAFERGEARNVAVLRWLIQHVRAEPVFDGLVYAIDDPDAPSEVAGLTEGDIRDAIGELIESYSVTGDPMLVMGKRETIRFTHVYPTMFGVNQVENIEALTAQAAPLLRVFLTERDYVSLPRSTQLVEFGEDVSRTPPQAFFEMKLLADQGLLSFRPMSESGSGASFMSVRTTSQGKQWLYKSARGLRG